MSKHIGLGVVFCAAMMAVKTQAASVAYENFEAYSAPLSAIGLDEGSGWTTPWSSNADAGSEIEIVERSLVNGELSGGNRAVRLSNVNGLVASNPTNAGEALSRNFTQQNTPSVYASALIRAENFSGNEFINFYFTSKSYADAGSNSGDYAEIHGGGLRNAAGNPFMIRVGNSVLGTSAFTTIDASPAPTDPADGAFLMVLKITKSKLDEDNTFYNRTELWVFDAATGAPLAEPAVADAAADRGTNLNTVDQFSIRTFSLGVDEFLLVDEIRIGTSWDAVVVPEPATLGLLAPAGLLCLRRRGARNGGGC